MAHIYLCTQYLTHCITLFRNACTLEVNMEMEQIKMNNTNIDGHASVVVLPWCECKTHVVKYLASVRRPAAGSPVRRSTELYGTLRIIQASPDH